MQDDDDDADEDDDDRLFFSCSVRGSRKPIGVRIETFDMDAVSRRHDDMQKMVFRRRN